jgi:hypothetical protein
MPDVVYHPNNPLNTEPPPFHPLNTGGTYTEPIPEDCIRDPDRTNPSTMILKRVISALKWGAGHQLIAKS